MDLCLDTIVCKVLLEFIPTFAKYGEDVPDTIPFRLWQTDEWILYLI